MKIARISIMFVMAISLLIFSGGCSDGGGGKPPEDDLSKSRPVELSGKAVVFGQVVSSDTGLGIAKANVKILVGNTSTLTTATYAGKETTDKKVSGPQFESTSKAKDIKTPLGDVGAVEAQPGTFSIEAVSAGTHKIEISADGFATFRGTIDVPTHTDIIYVPAIYNAAPIKLSKGFDAKVVVTADGAPKANVPVYVRDRYSRGTELQAVTDAGGIALFPGLAQNGDYSVTVPSQDFNGDGEYEFGTYHTYSNKYQGAGTQWSAALPKLLPGEELKVIATSCDAYPGLKTSVIAANPTLVGVAPPDMLGFVCGTSSAGLVSIAFNRPVQEREFQKTTLEAYDISKTDWFKDRDPLKATKVSTGATIELTSGNAVITITPDAALVENYVYSLPPAFGDTLQMNYMAGGKLNTKSLGPLLNEYLFGDPNLASFAKFYVVPDKPFDVSAVALDDYNNLPNTQGINIFAKLPAAATGTATITKYTRDKGKVAYILDGHLDKDKIVFDPPKPSAMFLCFMWADHLGDPSNPSMWGCSDANGNCGTDKSAYCAVPIIDPLLLPKANGDATLVLTGDTITVSFALTDAKGNPIAFTKDLTIH